MAEEQVPSADEAQKIVQGMIRAEVEKMRSEMLAERDGKTPSQQKPEDQLREVLSPYIQPGIDTANLNAADAVDNARFYRKFPKAIEFEDSIESQVQETRKRGLQLSRETIYKHLVGERVVADPDKYLEEAQKARDEKLKRASFAEDFPGGGFGRLKPEHIDLAEKFKPENFRKLPLEEKEKLLEGLAL